MNASNRGIRSDVDANHSMYVGRVAVQINRGLNPPKTINPLFVYNSWRRIDKKREVLSGLLNIIVTWQKETGGRPMQHRFQDEVGYYA